MWVTPVVADVQVASVIVVVRGLAHIDGDVWINADSTESAANLHARGSVIYVSFLMALSDSLVGMKVEKKL